MDFQGKTRPCGSHLMEGLQAQASSMCPIRGLGGPRGHSSEGFGWSRKGYTRHQLCDGHQQARRSSAYKHISSFHPANQGKSKLWKHIRAPNLVSQKPLGRCYHLLVTSDLDIRKQRVKEPGCRIHPGRMFIQPQSQSREEQQRPISWQSSLCPSLFQAKGERLFVAGVKPTDSPGEPGGDPHQAGGAAGYGAVTLNP